MEKELLEPAKKRFGEMDIHKNEQKVIHTQTSQKRISDLTKLVLSVKKKKVNFFQDILLQA